MAAMIYFRHKPDEVFTAIVRAAIERERRKLAAVIARHDLDAWETCYPHASRRFTLLSVLPAFERLLEAGQGSTVYRITDSMWLLLYECLANFCAELNDVAPDQPDGVLAVGDVSLAEIDFDALVALYFWDTDFLTQPGGPAGDDLRLEKVEAPAWSAHPEPWFQSGSRRYPDWDEGANF